MSSVKMKEVFVVGKWIWVINVEKKKTNCAT